MREVAAPPRSAVPSPAWLRDHLHWLVALFGGIYLIVLLARLSVLIGAVNWNSDSSSLFVIAELYDGGEAYRSSRGSWTTVWWHLLTQPLPGHRQLWLATAPTLMLATAGLMAWGAWRALGRHAALLVGALALAAGPVLLPHLLHDDTHNPVLLVTALLAVYLLALTRTDWPRALTAATVVAMGVIVGTNIASDALLIPAGVIPFVVAAALLRSRRIAAVAASTVVVSLIVAFVTSAVMRDAGWHSYPPHATFLTSGTFTSHVASMVEILVRLGNGDFFGERIGADSLVAVACAALVLLALPVPAVVAWRAFGERVHRVDATRAAYVGFWATAWLATALAFVLSTRGDTKGTSPEGYLIPMLYGIAALVPLAARRVASPWISAGVAVYVAAGVLALAEGRNEEPSFGSSMAQAHGELIAIAEKTGVTTGYAGYWDAANLTWNSRFRVHAYPIAECQPKPGVTGLCPFIYNRLASWYEPRPNTRTFLVVDPHTTWVSHPPPAELGPPVAFYDLKTVQLYVYPYDIASRFHCVSGPGCNLEPPR